jgi:hypothetical protein
MPCAPVRLARLLPIALCVAAVLAGLPARALATEAPSGPGEIRRRIEAVDRQIAHVQGQLSRDSRSSTRATWVLFKATRALDVAKLQLRDARIWGVAPDALRLSLLGPTPEEEAVANARARYRTLSGRRAGGAIRLVQTLRTRLAALELARAELAELLSRTPGSASPSWSGDGAPDAGQWARLFLAEIGAPACDENLVLVVAWQAQEGTDARFNPLATTHWMPGATDFNSVGVKDYRSVGQGLAASRETLEEGAASYGYGPILDSLRACADAEATAWFVNASAWCRGCTGGAYLTGLLPAVRADYASYAAR